MNKTVSQVLSVLIRVHPWPSVAKRARQDQPCSTGSRSLRRGISNLQGFSWCAMLAWKWRLDLCANPSRPRTPPNTKRTQSHFRTPTYPCSSAFIRGQLRPRTPPDTYLSVFIRVHPWLTQAAHSPEYQPIRVHPCSSVAKSSAALWPGCRLLWRGRGRSWSPRCRRPRWPPRQRLPSKGP